MQWVLLEDFIDQYFPALLVGIVLLQQQLFSIVTLPVEYDASNRAGWLENKRGLRSKSKQEQKMP
jgi:Zn-dependent membrane protease YugP